jgi:hypothetical protein
VFGLSEALMRKNLIDESLHFAATRRHIRDFAMETDEGQELNGLVTDMLE